MSNPVRLRVGIGYDFHPFQEDRPLFLGGVDIPHPRGLRGHSDADAALHAVADALLGAAGLGDIGTQFPDTDPRYKDISSLSLLDRVAAALRHRGCQVVNVDLVIIAEEPLIKPHVAAMKANLARVLHLDIDDVGVKATTMEGKGVIGRREGIAVQAVALIHQTGAP